MLELDKLKQEREQAYDVWFERWWAREDLEHQIKISNSQGYTGYVLVLDHYDKHNQARMSKDRFLLKLQEMLPGFEVEFRYKTNWLTKKDYLYGVRLSWS